MPRFACHYILVDVRLIKTFACSKSAQKRQKTVFKTLFLCCCAVFEHVNVRGVVWYLDRPETVFGSAFLLLLCSSLRHAIFTPGLMAACIFFILALNVTDVASLCNNIF